MLMDYWSDKALNHHTEATSMLYGSRECARILVEEGLDAAEARHRAAGQALASGLQAMGLTLFGDQRHRMTNVVGIHVPEGVEGEAVRRSMLEDFGIEIGTSFGPACTAGSGGSERWASTPASSRSCVPWARSRRC